MPGWKAIKLVTVVVLIFVPKVVWAEFYGDKKYGEYYEEEKDWVETKAVLPEIPKMESLVEYYVSVASSNKYYIAPQTISIAADGVVRYAAAVKTPNGVLNLSYEGLRCATKEFRLYAFGHSDGTWGKSRNEHWRAVRRGSYQATLFNEYFCPRGVVIFSPGEGADALRQGGHPLTK